MRTPSGRLAARQRLSSRRAFLKRWPYRSSPVAEPWRDSVWDSPLRIRRCGLGDVYGMMMSGIDEWRARPTATEPTTRCVAWDELPTMIATFSSGGLRRWRWPLRSVDRPWCPGAVRLPGRSAAAQLLVGLGAKILLDLVEVFFHFGYGAGGQRDEAGQVSHVHDVDGAGPALQLLGRGVQRAAGGRRPVIPHHEVLEARPTA